jgi:hypothetical protein
MDKLTHITCRYIKPYSSKCRIRKQNKQARLTHTVTRIDVIFRYPDRVPLTQNVHRAKKVFSM